jgi:hypothetical protein
VRRFGTPQNPARYLNRSLTAQAVRRDFPF